MTSWIFTMTQQTFAEKTESATFLICVGRKSTFCFVLSKWPHSPLKKPSKIECLCEYLKYLWHLWIVTLRSECCRDMEKCPENLNNKKAFKNKAWLRQAAKDKSNQSALEDEESTRLPYPLTTHFAAPNFFLTLTRRRRREEKVTSAKSFSYSTTSHKSWAQDILSNKVARIAIKWEAYDNKHKHLLPGGLSSASPPFLLYPRCG